MCDVRYIKTTLLTGILGIILISGESVRSQEAEKAAEKPAAVENAAVMPAAAEDPPDKPAAVAKNVKETPAAETPAVEKKAELPAVEAIVLGGFKQSFRPESPAPGWRYLWNGAGEIGHAANYRPLIWNKSGAYTPSVRFLAGSPAKGLMLDILSGYPGQGSATAPDKLDHYVIIAYTMQADSRGNVWLTDGNILKPIGGEKETIDLQVYVNDTLKYSDNVATAETPVLFQQDLGELKKGDTIYVAVGPDNNDAEDMFHLDFNLKILPPGVEPEEMLNMIKPPADIPDVKRLPGGKPSPAFLQKHEEFIRQAAETNPNVLFIGDSITAGWLEAGRAIWNKHVTVYKPLNLGINGDRIENVLWRLSNGEVDKIKPKVIVLMIGTNNLYMYSVDEICEGVTAILNELNDRLPGSKILLLGILPRAKSPEAKVRAKIRQINEQLVKMADGKDIRFLDFGAELIEPDGSISEEIMPDYMHLSETGYNTWFDEMSPSLIEMLGLDKE